MIVYSPVKKPALPALFVISVPYCCKAAATNNMKPHSNPDEIVFFIGAGCFFLKNSANSASTPINIPLIQYLAALEENAGR